MRSLSYAALPLLQALSLVTAQIVNIESIWVNMENGEVDGFPLPGNLVGLKNITTKVGKDIANILMSQDNSQGGNTIISADDTTHVCAKWAEITSLLTPVFRNSTTRECTDLARAAVRAGFHDAGTWSRKLAAASPPQDYGGADGSIYIFGEDELARGSNAGLSTVVTMLGDMAIEQGVGIADMIQFAAAHATVTCPLGARMRTFVGRPDATKAAPDGLLPDAHIADATVHLDLFADKNISPVDLVALVGAHSVSKAANFDPENLGASQDSTPGVWDSKFYKDTIRSEWVTTAGMLTFPSDKALSLHRSLQDEWNGYVVRQADWIDHFARAYLRLSLVGVKDIQGMTECTDALPLHIAKFP